MIAGAFVAALWVDVGNNVFLIQTMTSSWISMKRLQLNVIS